VARNVATLDPAGTVTEAGTVRLAALDARFTVAPLEALTVTVHALEAPGPKVDGEHTSAVAVTVAVGTLTSPPVRVSGRTLPSAAAPTPLIRPIEALLLPERVPVKAATTPLEIGVAFIPHAMHVYEPDAPAQLTLFPAADRADPAATFRLEMVEG
jgi:hypothetical protein